MSVTYAKIMQVLNGERKPEDHGEVALLTAFTKAVNGEPLITIMITDKMNMDLYSLEEIQMFLMGYAIGQKDFLDKLGGLDLSKIIKDDDETTH